MIRTAGKFLIGTGLAVVLFALYLILQRHNPQNISFALTTFENKKESISSESIMPARIYINSINLDLPIDITDFKNNQWKVSDKGVSYLKETPVPGQKGNSILYGHNWNSLLGKLHLVKPGDIIQIQYTNGRYKNFKIAYTIKVSPDATHILHPTNDRRITIYTCTDFMDSKRFAAIALLTP